MGLERGDHIGKFGGLDSMEEDPAARAVAVVEIHFPLETKVE
jgi:hypothetical protein